jgi:AcrR family transcriptional regulator
MKRDQSENRLDQLLAAAAKVFIARGYRRTAMADIAREMGVAPGTIYLYVESKEALFHLLAMRAVIDPEAALPEIPVKTPPAGATIEMLKKALSVEAYAPRLAAAARRPGPAANSEEFKAAIRELYDSAYSHRDGINLLERSSIDWPDMAAVFYQGLRSRLVTALMAYLEKGIHAGVFRPLPHVDVAARFIVETVAWFAIHRHGDQGGPELADDAAREGVIELVVAAIEQPAAGAATQPRHRRSGGLAPVRKSDKPSAVVGKER